MVEIIFEKPGTRYAGVRLNQRLIPTVDAGRRFPVNITYCHIYSRSDASRISKLPAQ